MFVVETYQVYNNYSAPSYAHIRLPALRTFLYQINVYCSWDPDSHANRLTKRAEI